MQPMAARADVSLPEEWAGDPARRRRGGKFARKRVRACQKGRPAEEVGRLLLERRGREPKACLGWGLDHLSLEELVSLSHLRRAVERGCQGMKGELGWDRSRGGRGTDSTFSLPPRRVACCFAPIRSHGFRRVASCPSEARAKP